MILAIRNVRGIAAADLDLSGQITAVFGPNAAGKSSVALALRSLLTGNASPITLKARGADDIMCATGSAKGVATLTAGDSRIMITWPKGTIQTTGDPEALPTATEYSAGLVSLVDLAPAERAKVVAAIFKTAPTRAELDAALAEADLAKSSDRLWIAIEDQGWDATSKAAADAAKALKGQWREATGGATWGSAQGGSWTPDGWSIDLEDATEDHLQELLAEAERARDEAVASGAVAGDRRAELERTAALGTTAAQQIGRLEKELQGAQADHQAALDARAKLPEHADSQQVMAITCGECGAHPLRLEDGPPDEHGKTKKMAVRFDPTDQEELKRIRLEIASADGKASNARGRVQDLQARLASSRSDAETARAAQEKLAETKPASGPDVAGATAARDRAARHLEMFRAKDRADQIHHQIARQLQIAAITGPAGVRKKKLGEVLGVVNANLAELSRAMKVAPVELDQDLEATLGGRAYVALSDSEKWRVRTVLQLEIARRDGSAMVVLDGCDILDNRGRGGLAAALKVAGVTALLAMTTNAPAPDAFKAAKIGRSYWVQDGRAMLMDEAVASKERAAA